MKNGPLCILVTMDRIDNRLFKLDDNNNLRYINENQSKIITNDEYVKVELETVLYHNYDTQIKAIGILKDVATENEKKQFLVEQFKEEEEFIDYSEIKKTQTAN